MTTRTRPPRPGTIVADIAEYLRVKNGARIAAIHADVNARRRRRGLPTVPAHSIRGALNSNKGNKGHGLFRCEQRGVYSLSKPR